MNLKGWLRPPVILTALSAISFLWVAWPSLTEMAQRWMSDPRYSHGVLVPGFALYLLWVRSEGLAVDQFRPSWWGIPLILSGAGLGLAGVYLYIEWFEFLGLLPMLAGVAVAAGGWAALRWSFPSIAFLFFMIPLPYRVELALGYPLQRIATITSTFCLQTLGLSAVAEGNIILMNEARIGVVEACNGLGMLFMFLAFSVATAMVVKNPLVDKTVIVLSAIPIAMIANVVRITVTGVLYETAGGLVADAVYHDLAGWLMMPVALAAFCIELSLLSHVFIDVKPANVGPLTMDLLVGPYGDADRSTGREGPLPRR